MPTKVIASSLGLIGFIIAILAGLAVDNPATTTLWRALCAMLICYIVGAIIGAVATRAVNEHIDQYKKTHPLIGENDDATDVVQANATSAPAPARSTNQRSTSVDTTERAAARSGAAPATETAAA